MLAPLQIVDSVRLSIESLGIDTYTFSHTQGDIHDSATIRKDTIRASTGAISTNLSACIDTIPVHLEAYTVVTSLGGCYERGALHGVAGISRERLASGVHSLSVVTKVT